MMDHRRVSTAGDLARVWVHETRRVFADRLISYEDKGWFEDLAKKQGEEHLGLDWDETIGAPGTPKSFLMYADFLIPGADPKVCGRTRYTGWGWRGLSWRVCMRGSDGARLGSTQYSTLRVLLGT